MQGLGAQSVTLLSTLRDPTQLRRRQCACPCYAMFERNEKNSNSYCSSEGKNRPDKQSTARSQKKFG
jgi:hypothetical protein